MLTQPVKAGTQGSKNNQLSEIPELAINPTAMGYPSFSEVFNNEFSQSSNLNTASGLEPPGPMQTPEQLQPSTPAATEAELYPSTPPVSESELSNPPSQLDTDIENINSPQRDIENTDVDTDEQVKEEQPSSSEEAVSKTDSDKKEAAEEGAQVENDQPENQNAADESSEVELAEVELAEVAAAELAAKTMALEISGAANSVDEAAGEVLEETKETVIAKAGQDMVDRTEEAVIAKAGQDIVDRTEEAAQNAIEAAKSTSKDRQTPGNNQQPIDPANLQAGIAMAKTAANDKDIQNQPIVGADQKQPEHKDASKPKQQLTVENTGDGKANSNNQRSSNQVALDQQNNPTNSDETNSKQQAVDVSAATEAGKVEPKGDPAAQPPPINPDKLDVAAASATKATGPARSTEARDLSPTQQIVRNIEILVKEGQTSMRVKLYPESLGRIELQMVKTGDGVTVVLIPDLASTGKLLESQLGELRQALAGAGIALNDLNIGQKDQAQDDEARRGWRRSGGAGIYFDDEIDDDDQVLHLEYAVSAFDYRI